MNIISVMPLVSGGGAETLVAQLHDIYIKTGLNSHIVIFSRADKKKLINTHFLNFNNVWNPLIVFELYKYLKKIIARHGDIDVIHVHLTPAQVFVPLAVKFLFSKPLLITTEHSTNNRRRKYFLGRLFDKWLYSKYSKIICVSEAVYKSFMSWQPQLSVKAVIVNNGIQINQFISKDKLFKKDHFKIISVGRLIDAKNYSTALRAVSLFGNDFNVKYEIVGVGPLREELNELAEKLNILERVTFLGWRDDIPALLAEADIFLITSKWEGFGLVALEAMASGLPVVSSNIAALSDVLGDHGQAAYLVPYDDHEGFYTYLNKLILSESVRKRMATSAQVRSKLFSIEDTAQKYLQLYAERRSSQSAKA